MGADESSLSLDWRPDCRAREIAPVASRWIVCRIFRSEPGDGNRIKDAGGVADISRWCKPPVPTTKCGEPWQGRRSDRRAIPQPRPGLGFNLHDVPVVCTTG